MHVSYQDMLDTPIEIIISDLAFRDTEVRAQKTIDESKNK